MKKAVVYGAGGTGRRIANLISGQYDLVAFVDNDKTKNGTMVMGRPVYLPDYLPNIEFDVILPGSLMGIDEITNDILERGIPADKIERDYLFVSVRSREYFLYRFAEMAYRQGLRGSVAEAGVYRGEFAKEINKSFYDRKCYLFDTFEGFNEKDISVEQEGALVEANYLKDTSVDIVMKKMKYPQQCIIRKGYFPQTAEGISDEFCFVNLDMDLYQPILNGLRFFYPKMVERGVILIHDYFSDAYPNVRKAVEDYENEHHILLHKMPIGDDISVAIIK